MSNEILEIVGKIIAGAFFLLVAYLTPTLKTWIGEKLNATQLANLTLLISSFVQAAEQLYKTEDKSGSAKKEYVVDELKKLGFSVGEQVDAMIEAAVYALPKGGDRK